MRSMLVGFGGQESTKAALQWSSEVAASTGTPLTVATRLKLPLASTTPDEYSDQVNACHAVIDELLRRAQLSEAEVDIEAGEPLEALVELAEQCDPAMVVVSADEHADAEDHGGFGVRLLRTAHHPVAVIPGEYEPPAGGTFVVGVDGSDANKAALSLAEQLAREMGGSIKAVFAYDVIDDTYNHAEGWHRHSKEVRAELRHITSVPVDLVMEPGPADMVLQDVAEREHAAAIIVGTRGRMSLGGRVLGHVPVDLMHNARCPVIAVPH